jgi:GntR family transcriptional regulator
MPSDFVLSQSDGRSLYVQVIEQIRRRIAVGDLKPGQPLPSIRQLAADLGISVITIKRAYLELERDGVISTHHGKGSIVTADSGLGARIYEQELARHLDEAARLGALLGISPRELQRRVREAADRLAGFEQVRR